jgi:hypothetical protein
MQLIVSILTDGPEPNETCSLGKYLPNARTQEATDDAIDRFMADCMSMIENAIRKERYPRV